MSQTTKVTCLIVFGLALATVALFTFGGESAPALVAEESPRAAVPSRGKASAAIARARARARKPTRLRRGVSSAMGSMEIPLPARARLLEAVAATRDSDRIETYMIDSGLAAIRTFYRSEMKRDKWELTADTAKLLAFKRDHAVVSIVIEPGKILLMGGLR